MKNTLRYFIAALLLCAGASAQTFTAISANNITDASGTLIAQGQICFQAVDSSDSPTSFNAGGTGNAISAPVCKPIVNGAVTGMQVANPAASSPAIWYDIWATKSGSSQHVIDYKAVSWPSASTWSLDAYSPAGAVYVPPTGGTVNGNLSVNGSISSTQPQSGHFCQFSTQAIDVTCPPFNVKGDGVTVNTSGIQAAIATASALQPSSPNLYFPAGIYLTGDVTYSASSIQWKGDGALQTVIRHIDGDPNPLIHNTASGAGSPPPAYPSGGFVGITFQGGSQTTALIYVDGQIDSHMKFDDLRFQGSTGASTMDAVSTKDYLNWGLHRVRWDNIGGWGIKVRGNSLVFNEGHLVVDDFSYDNGTSTNTWGNGLFFMDAATGTPLSVFKGPIVFSNGRIEINRPLNGGPPSRGIIRILQDQTTWNSAAGPNIQLALKSVGIDANNADATIVSGKDMKVISLSAGDVALSFDDVSVFGTTEWYGNDAGTQKWLLPIVSFNQTTRVFSAKTPGHTGISSTGTVNTYESHYGSTHFWAETDNNRSFIFPLRRGDIIWNRDPLNDASHAGRNFGCKAVQAGNGYFHGNPAGVTLALTGSMTSGSNLLTLSSTIPGTIIENTNLTVTGAGAAGADLSAVVTAVNFTTNVVTLGDGAGNAVNAGTTVSAAAVKLSPAQLFCVDMVQYGTAAPTTGAYQRGDKVINTTPSANGLLGWVNTASGSPGSFAGIPTGDASGKLNPTTQLNSTGTPSSTTFLRGDNSWAATPGTLLNWQKGSTAITGTSATATVYSYAMPAGTMTAGSCIRASAYFLKTGATSTIYMWKFGATATVPPSGQSSTLATGTLGKSTMIVCADPASTTAETLLADPINFGGSWVAGGNTTATENLANAVTLSFTFNVANTDSLTPLGFLVERIQ